MRNKEIKNHNSEYSKVNNKVLRDKNISLGAKALYSYLSTFNDLVYGPEKETILSELNIKEMEYLNYLKELENKGIINID